MSRAFQRTFSCKIWRRYRGLTSPVKFAHLAEKSEKFNGSISNLSTKVTTSKASSYTRERFRDTLEKRAWSWKGCLSAPYVLDGAPNVSGLYELEAGAASLGKGAFSMCVSPGKHLGLQIRASKFQSSSSTFPRARTCELHRARSRLYRSQIMQVNTRWKALPRSTQ